MKVLRQKGLWCDWLINYIPELKKMMVGVKDKIMSLFKTNTTDNSSKPTRVNNVYRGRKKLRKTKSKKTIIDNIIKAIKEKIIRDVKTHLEQEKEDYYKPVRVANFYSNNYIEYESNNDKNKTQIKESIKEYLDEIRLYLKDVVNSLKKI